MPPPLQVCKSLVRYGTTVQFDANITTPGLPAVHNMFTVSLPCFAGRLAWGNLSSSVVWQGDEMLSH